MPRIKGKDSSTVPTLTASVDTSTFNCEEATPKTLKEGFTF